MSERKTEQVRHCLCTTTPSLPVSLPICLSAQLSAFNASSFTFICFSVFYIFLHCLCSTSHRSFCLKGASPPSLPACIFNLLPFFSVFNPKFERFKAEPLLLPLPSPPEKRRPPTFYAFPATFRRLILK